MTKYTKPSWLRTTNAARPKWVQDEQQAEDKRPRYSTTGTQNVYQSERWRRLRKGYLMKHPLCEKCEAIGITSAANVLDHIIPINSGGATWDRANWMGLCDECHNIKRGREKHNKVAKGKPNDNGQLIPVDRHEAL